MSENQNLKLIFDFLVRKIFCRSKMSGARVVDYDIKMTSFSECSAEGIADRTRIDQIQSYAMQTWQLWNALCVS